MNDMLLRNMGFRYSLPFFHLILMPTVLKNKQSDMEPAVNINFEIG